MVDLPSVRFNVPYVENTHIIDFCPSEANSAIQSKTKLHMADLGTFPHMYSYKYGMDGF